MREGAREKMNDQDYYQTISDKVIDRFIPRAMEAVRAELCDSCPDQKCLTESVCGAFLLMLRAHIWAMQEEASMWN